MQFIFSNLKFAIENQKIRLVQAFETKPNLEQKDLYALVEVHIAGENQNAHVGAKHILCSETQKLYYVSHVIDKDLLVVKQENEHIEVLTYYQTYKNTNVIRSWSKVTNKSKGSITLDHVSSFLMFGLGEGIESANDLYFYRFTNSWHVECQPRIHSFFDLGMFGGNSRSMKKISGFNTGSWSTKEELPQAIIEDRSKKHFLMFQIESSSSWYYEISDYNGLFYLNVGGPNNKYNHWCKKLSTNESFTTQKVSIGYSNSLNGVIEEMTMYRRCIVKKHEIDQNLPTVFNEYMHFSWDNPNEERTIETARAISQLGIDYYVIDCGWHDEVDGFMVYPYVGKWIESKKRYPSGLKNTLNEIKKLGMKPGLWIEPEIIGYLCLDMKEYYGDDCFIQRDGKIITIMNRIFLDFRNKKVQKYLSETIDCLVNEYGAEYIKFDYNQDMGPGTDLNSSSLGDGLLQHSAAYQSWLSLIIDKYPNVIFEACASGGQRMDYQTLSYHTITSSSDQTDYQKYPYIVGNILSAVLPEQAGVWSYPVDSKGLPNEEVHLDAIEVNKRIDEEKVIFNMVNATLGRTHLASNIRLLNDSKISYIKEAIMYYKEIIEIKKNGSPYFPLGFTDFNQDFVTSGIKTKDIVILCVWNLKNKRTVEIQLSDLNVMNVEISYPKSKKLNFEYKNDTLKIDFTEDYQARVFEIKLDNK